VVATVPTGATATVKELAGGQFEIESSASSSGPIVVEVPGGVIELGPGDSLSLVAIDIKPGGVPNPIKLTKKGVVAVAILTTRGFDAAAVDPRSVCFGDAEDGLQRDCTEAHGRGHLEDVDRDNDLDLVLHYEALETGIDPGDAKACLTGETMGGDVFAGCDSVVAMP